MAFQPTYPSSGTSTFTPVTSSNDPTFGSVLAMTRAGTNELAADAYILGQNAIANIYIPDDNEVMADLEMRNAVVSATNRNIYHWEGGSLIRPFTIVEVISVTTTVAEVRLDTADYVSRGDTPFGVSGGTAGQYAPVTVNDTLMLGSATGWCQATIRRKSGFAGYPSAYTPPAHMNEATYVHGDGSTTALSTGDTTKYTIELLSGTMTSSKNLSQVLGAVGTGKTVIGVAFSNNQSEGGYLPLEMKLRTFKRFLADFQIPSSTVQFSGTATNAEYAFQLPDTNTNVAWNDQVKLAMKDLRMKMGFGVIFSLGGSATDGITGKSMTFARGVLPQTVDRGNVYTFDRATGWQVADTKAFIRNIQTQNGYRSMTLNGGTEVLTGVQDGIITQGGTNGGLFFGDLSKDYIAKMSPSGIVYAGQTLMIQPNLAYSHRMVTGLKYQPYGAMAIAYPNRNVEIPNPNGGGNYSNKAIQVRYIPRQGQMYYEVKTDPSTQRRDVWGYDIFCEYAVQISGAREFYAILGT